VSLQQNVLIFEDDVQCDKPVTTASLQPFVDAAKGDQVVCLNEKYDGCAYVVTPESAAILLDLHLNIVSPINYVQMSVDHRLGWSASQGYIQRIFAPGHDFYQTCLREESDLEWNSPIGLGKEIIHP
jgi:hypothetical protein